MPIVIERAVFKVGEDSYALTIPKAWISSKKIKHGDLVEIVIDDEIIIRAISPSEDKGKS
ncbi:AbrB/MazE/SpoVT family DNA-binding domain-containing protein [Chloroflexota bacterium]